jgi:cytosine permease
MASLPDYVAKATPVPSDARVAWYSGIAPTYAGVMVWFAFWQLVPGMAGGPAGVLSAGIAPALIGVVLAALIIHFLFYVVPGLMGMRTGLPLYVVGTSLYGTKGGLFMPGFLMGILQFFWLGFNAFFVSDILCRCFEIGLDPKAETLSTAVPGSVHSVIAIAFAVLGAFMGLKGIQYVAKVATFLPIIPIVVLLILFVNTMGGLGEFSPEKIAEAKGAEVGSVSAMVVILGIITGIVGFFATAGAAGVDISMNAKDDKNVHVGGMVGILAATVFSAGLAVLVVAGYYGGAADVPEKLAGDLNPTVLMKGGILGEGFGNVLMILLAISSFPAACFSALIAANSFKTTLPNVNPVVSVGIGTAGACLLAVTGWAGDAAAIFAVIGATFGPVCGSMCAEFLINGGKWPGPRAGMNPAGWIAWIVGTTVGVSDLIARIPGLEGLAGKVPSPVMLAFIIGFVLYFILAKAGLESKSIPMPSAGAEGESA